MWGYFYIPSNYSLSLTDLAVSRKFAENETLEGSRVHVTMDMSRKYFCLFKSSGLKKIKLAKLLNKIKCTLRIFFGFS